jgi:hypothetical protein
MLIFVEGGKPDNPEKNPRRMAILDDAVDDDFW